MKVVVCQVCKKELTEQPLDCANTNCPYKGSEDSGSIWEDLLDTEVEVNGEPVGCLDVFGGGDGGCLREFGGCLLLPFKLFFQVVVGFFKVVAKVLSVFDD